MHKTLRPVIVLGLAAVFTVASVVCCCVRNIVPVTKAHACCASKAKADSSHKAGDCGQCSSSLKIAEAAQSVHFTPVLSLAFKVFPARSTFVLHPAKIAFLTLWTNGPPGFYSAVPLYIQSPSLRI